ncbi:hypothetical protein THAOC_37872, partial [Thalassiosira oceanica]
MRWRRSRSEPARTDYEPNDHFTTLERAATLEFIADAARESREHNGAQSFADEIASLAVDEDSLTDEFPCERYESSGLSPRNADVDADVDGEKPMDNKSESCRSNGYEPVIVSSPELRVQPTKSQNEEKSPLFTEIGHELVGQVFISPGTSKDEIDGSRNVSMIPENPTEEGREGRDEDENGARAEEDGEESCGSCGSMDDEESAKPPVPTSFSAKPNPMMDYVPQYNLCKKDSKVKEGKKKKKKKKDGVHGGGEKIDVDQALEHYYEMEKLLPGETPPIITMSSSASTETLEPVDLARLKTVLDSEPQSEIDSLYARIIEDMREEIEDFEAAENREDKVDMLLQCYGSFMGDSTLASDIDDDTIATEKDVATTRMKTKLFDASWK